MKTLFILIFIFLMSCNTQKEITQVQQIEKTEVVQTKIVEYVGTIKSCFIREGTLQTGTSTFICSAVKPIGQLCCRWDVRQS